MDSGKGLNTAGAENRLRKAEDSMLITGFLAFLSMESIVLRKHHIGCPLEKISSEELFKIRNDFIKTLYEQEGTKPCPES